MENIPKNINNKKIFLSRIFDQYFEDPSTVYKYNEKR